jgi:hypothetical protein
LPDPGETIVFRQGEFAKITGVQHRYTTYQLRLIFTAREHPIPSGRFTDGNLYDVRKFAIAHTCSGCRPGECRQSPCCHTHTLRLPVKRMGSANS